MNLRDGWVHKILRIILLTIEVKKILGIGIQNLDEGALNEEFEQAPAASKEDGKI